MDIFDSMVRIGQFEVEDGEEEMYEMARRLAVLGF